MPFIGNERPRACTRSGAWTRAARIVAFGSDWSVSSPNPFEQMETAITRLGAIGDTTTPWMPEERITLAQAIEAFTINAAYMNRDEKDTGSLEVGKRADLAVLDRNLFDIPATEISETKVLSPCSRASRCTATWRTCNEHAAPSRRSGRPAAADQARHDQQRRVPAGAAVAGEPARQRARAGGRGRECAAPRHRPARFPAVGLRRREHAARIQRRQCRRRAHRRLLRPARRGGDRARSGRRNARDRRVHLRRAGPLRRPDRGLAQDRAGIGVLVVAPKAGCALARRQDPAQPSRLPDLGGIREGRLPRQRHRHDGAVVRAGAARRLAARDRVGRQRAAHRRSHGRQPPPDDPRPREPEPAGRRRGHAAAQGASSASAPGRPTRSGDRTARASSSTTTIGIRFVEEARRLGVKVICVHKGLPFGAEVLRAQPVPRHRPDREALPRRELPRSTTRAS